MAGFEISDLKGKALDYLTRREHSRQELKQKLQDRCSGADEEDVLQVLDSLEESGYLSDKRCAESMVRNAISKGHGPNRLRQSMRQKGLDLSLLDNSDAYQASDWDALAVEVKQKRFGLARPANYSDRAKQARFLSGRGFFQEHIENALAGTMYDDE